MDVEAIARVIEHCVVVKEKLQRLSRPLFGFLGKADDRKEMEGDACVTTVLKHGSRGLCGAERTSL